MGIIEQAAERLERLRRAGVDVPDPSPSAGLVAASDRGAAAAAVRDAGARSRQVTIDFEQLTRAGLIRPDRPRSLLAEEYRAIKRPILGNARAPGAGAVQRGNCIMVTSSLNGEGKTFTSLNLALSMAMEIDRRVLLVDADAMRPAILERLGLPPAPGLLDLLTEPDLKMSDVILRTNIDKLSLLPAGSSQGQATELLASQAMRRLVEELASRYADRIIVFDAPPLLMSNESRVLAAQVGQIVVVVEARKTLQNTLQQALATIESCPMVMTLLNKSQAGSSGGQFGYYG